MRYLKGLFAATLGAISISLCAPAAAHQASDAYLLLAYAEGGISLRLDIALRDLDAALDLDADGNGELTWAEVRSAWPAIDHYVLDHLRVAHCPLGNPSHALERRSDGVYAALSWQTQCPTPEAPAIAYTLLAEIDPTHRGLARIQWPGSAVSLRVLNPAEPISLPDEAAQALPAAAASAPASQPQPQAASSTLGLATAASTHAAEHRFVSEGLHHILSGYDHLLFLVCLLLPLVRADHGRANHARQTWQQTWLPAIGIVTAFTVAHSITLALAAMRWVTLPGSVIEPLIALTILLTAIDNLRPFLPGPRPVITFAFGLIHGFGFADVLAELDLPRRTFAWALLQFNLGIEIGQLLVVSAALVALLALRRFKLAPPWALGAGSVVSGGLACVWLIERTVPLRGLG